MTKVLGVGGTGFIGSHLSYRLESLENYSCTLADIWSSKARLRFENRPFTYRHLDIMDDDALLDELVSDHDVVFNMASVVLPRQYITAPLDVVRLILFGGNKVIESCVRHRKRLIHFSTSEVYGKSLGSQEPFNEDTSDCVTGPIRNQRWIYSTTKQLMDRMIHAHGLADALDYTIVRPFNVIGPLIDHVMSGPQDGNPRVFAHFMSALMRGEPLRLVDGGHARRTFLYVDDLIAALIAILDHPAETNRQIINIGNPANEVRISQLADLMRQIFDQRFGPSGSPIISVPGHEFYGEGYEDMDRRMPDISKIRAIGWEPTMPLKSMLETTMDYTWENRHRLTQAAMDNDPS